MEWVPQGNQAEGFPAGIVRVRVRVKDRVRVRVRVRFLGFPAGIGQFMMTF